jgi:hypothetical protein
LKVLQCCSQRLSTGVLKASKEKEIGMGKSLADYASEARRRADAERGKRDYFQPPDGREAHIRILEWPGHKPCWVEYYVHYLETQEGKRVLTCGESNCYTCQRLAELAHSQDKDDLEFVKQSGRKLKIFMYVLDWDNISAGPQLWEPKNTQSCGTWSTLINLFTAPDYGEKVYEFNQGLLINLQVVKETRKLRSGSIEMAIQKSCYPGTSLKPIRFAADAGGNMWIQIALQNGEKKRFQLPDLNEIVGKYDEDYHRRCWGDEAQVPESAAPEILAGDDDIFGGSEPAAPEAADDLFAEPAVAASQPAAPAPPTAPPVRTPPRAPAAPKQPARGRPAGKK